jgi:hypothetical protein
MATDKTRKTREDWAHIELDRIITQAQNTDALSRESSMLISDPAFREQLITNIKTHIWPGIQRLFQGTDLVADPSGQGQLTITQEWLQETTMSFLFLVWHAEDAGRNPGDIPYFCRLKVKYSQHSYLFKIDFFIHFPESFDMQRLKALMGNPRFAGNPPKLIYETGHDDQPGVLVIEFRFGRGYGNPIQPLVQTMLADMAEHVHFLRRLVRAVRLLGSDYDNEQHLLSVERELEMCFTAQ